MQIYFSLQKRLTNKKTAVIEVKIILQYFFILIIE